MAIKARGERKITIGDKTYTLFFDMNALAELEDALNRTLPQISEIFQDQTKVGIKFMRSLLWAGLLRHHGLSLEEAGEVMSEADDLGQLFSSLGEAFAAAFRVDEKKIQEAQKKMKNGTGK